MRRIYCKRLRGASARSLSAPRRHLRCDDARRLLGPASSSPAEVKRGQTPLRKCDTGVTLRGIPTKRPRHAITETEPVREALEELRHELGDGKIELGELVILGAREKAARLRAERVDVTKRRRELAERIRQGDVPVDRDGGRRGPPLRLGPSVTTLLMDNSAWARLAAAPPSTGRARSPR